MKIEYLFFSCEPDDLQERLTPLGEEMWRLCTCEFIAAQGLSGTGSVQAYVVMDRFIDQAEDEHLSAGESAASEGIPMKG